MKLVEIVWLDSGVRAADENEAWRLIVDIVRDTKLVTVNTAGYLAAEDEHAYYVIQTTAPDGTGFNLTAIAKQNVKQLTYLRRR